MQPISHSAQTLLCFFPLLFALRERSLAVFINKARLLNLIKLSCCFKRMSANWLQAETAQPTELSCVLSGARPQIQARFPQENKHMTEN